MTNGEIRRMTNEAAVTEMEIAELIVSVLRLEISPRDIKPDEPLFNEGLSLDSIDALELAFEIEGRYGIKIQTDRRGARAIFASLRALTAFIDKNRQI
jgi:acyl carrier protein